jgi:glycosyltransferase involved in cell wall biosynthesis
MSKIVLGISSSFCANFLKGQVAFFHNQGWEVVIVSGPGEEISLLSKKENAKLYNIPFSRSIAPITDFIHLIRLINILKKEKPDVVNAGNPKSGFLIMIACWLLGIKNRIFTLHGLVSDSRKGFSKWLIRTTETITCRLAAKVIVVSHSLMHHAVKDKIVKQSKALVIANGSCNGIDVEEFKSNELVMQEAAHLRNSIGLNKKNIVIGFVGRVTKDKGVDILIDAVTELKNKYPHVNLLIAGPAKDEVPITKKHTQQLYGDEHIIYLGKMYDMPQVYALMHILVLPSLREGLPNVLLEAGAMRLPSITTNIPGCSDVIKDGYTGMLFEKNDLNTLLHLLEVYINDADLRKQHGNNAYEFVSTHFSQTVIWQAQAAIYQQLLNNK